MPVPTTVDEGAKLIAVTGPTGAGKTTFINAVCGSHLRVGSSLHSCTDTVQVAHCKIGGENITLIDTPGFDDTTKSQSDILKDIADFLEQTYERGKKLSGVIYMHRISDYRVGGIARENFRLFTKICGKNAMKNVLIVTTMWDEVPEMVGEQRELELAGNSLFFKAAIDEGARMYRLQRTQVSVANAMIPFLDYHPKTLLLQREIVEEQKRLLQTSAGIELQSELESQTERHHAEMKDLQAEMNTVLARKEASHKADMDEMREALAALQEKVAVLANEMGKLRADGSPRGARGRQSRPGMRARLIGSASRSLSPWLGRGSTTRSFEVVRIERHRDGGGCLDGRGFDV